MEELIAELQSLEAAVEAHNATGKPLRAQLWARMFDLANQCAAQGIDEFTTTAGDKVKPNLKSRVVIRGGAKDSPERQRVLETLEALGHGDKIVTYRDIRKDALAKVWESVPAEAIQSMLDEGLIRIEQQPEIKVGRRKLGKLAAQDSEGTDE